MIKFNYHRSLFKKPSIFQPCKKRVFIFGSLCWCMIIVGIGAFYLQHTAVVSTNLTEVFIIFITIALAGVTILFLAGQSWCRSIQDTWQYRYILDQVHDCVYLLDAQSMRFIYVNKSGCKQIEYSNKELLSMTPADIKPEFTLEELKVKFSPLVKGEKDNILFETVHLTKEGRLVPVEVLVQYLPIEEVKYFLAVARDITDKRKAIAEKEIFEEKIREAQRMEGLATLASGIAHDFNNLLTAIMGYTQLAMTQVNQNDQIAKDLNVIMDAGKQARDVVQQILTFSRERSGTMSPTRLQPLVKEVVKMIKVSLPRSIKIVQEIDEDAESVMADPAQMHQLMMNLCVNAMHAMEESGGVLTVSLTVVEIEFDTSSSPDMPPPGRYVKITVADTGRGMEPWIVNRIFEPYFTTKGKGKGTGLGLAVVHGIVKGHGGHITVDSEPGRGTTFDIYLPEKTQKKSYNRCMDKDLADESPRPGSRIMVVDDERSIVKLIERILTGAGHKVTAFSSPEAALQAFSKAPDSIDILLTDLDMPGVNGMTLARKIKNLRPDLPVVICTGHGTQIIRADLEQIGIKDILLKPLTSSDLLKTVTKALAKKSAHR